MDDYLVYCDQMLDSHGPYACVALETDGEFNQWLSEATAQDRLNTPCFTTHFVAYGLNTEFAF